MPAPDTQNLNINWCSELVRSLYTHGCRHVVISPGSRSTPLTLAFAAHPGFRKYVSIDERSAAFTSLGIAKASGMPACLVCTSGTAVANYYPAVIEATQSGVPMIVLSADRPPSLRNTGASQTIDQIKIFGDTPVFFHEAGLPDPKRASLQRLSYLAQQAVSESVNRRGVAHINLPFEKPFEPEADVLRQLTTSFTEQVRSSSEPISLSKGHTLLSEHLTDLIASARKPVVIAGPSEKDSHSASAATALSDQLQAPLLAEPGSGIAASNQQITGFDGFLRSTERMDELKPDLILRFGQEPVSKALARYMEHHHGVEQIRFNSGPESGDSMHTVSHHIELYGRLDVADLENAAASSSWLSSWKHQAETFHAKRKQILDSEHAFTDGHVMSLVTKTIPPEIPFFCSNSFPIRDISLFGEYQGRTVLVNRGAAGIDGITSTASGVIHGADTTCVLLTGDIAFLHDSNALLQHRDLEKPLIVILFNNGGGTIFRMLPVHEFKDQYLKYFETPQQVDIKALCTAHGIPHRAIQSRSELKTALHTMPDTGGIHVFECKTDADASMNARHLLWNN